MPTEVSGPQSASSTATPVTPGFGRPEPAKERADAARNRRKILDAAERLFAELGYQGTSIRSIAKEAGDSVTIRLEERLD